MTRAWTGRMKDLPWLLTAEAVQGLHVDACTVIDVRSRMRFALSNWPGAIRISWLDFRDGFGRTGKLRDDLPGLASELAERGVRHNRPVIVYGAAGRGWGEDGRVAWMLRYLGYPDVRMVDGGWRAISSLAMNRGKAHPNAEDLSGPRPMPPLPLRIRHELRASIDDVQQIVDGRGRHPSMLLDTRSAAEWNGSRRYWPSRAGRIPGAVHLPWHTLLDDRGMLDDSPAARARIAQLGLQPDRPVVAYCVGGVRSAHVLVMLRALGFSDVRNYDGSWYEWAADRRRPVEQP